MQIHSTSRRRCWSGRYSAFPGNGAVLSSATLSGVTGKTKWKWHGCFSEDGRFFSIIHSYKTPALHFNFETWSALFIQPSISLLENLFVVVSFDIAAGYLQVNQCTGNTGLILERQWWGENKTTCFILEWTITLILKTDSQPRDSWICHVRWNVTGTVSQMRQRLHHRGPAVPKSITLTMEQCSGNAQCLTMDTNCWLT